MPRITIEIGLIPPIALHMQDAAEFPAATEADGCIKYTAKQSEVVDCQLMRARRHSGLFCISLIKKRSRHDTFFCG